VLAVDGGAITLEILAERNALIVIRRVVHAFAAGEARLTLTPPR
jgi:hypothetical protein